MVDVIISPSSQTANQYAGGGTGVADSEHRHMRDIAQLAEPMFKQIGIDALFLWDTDLATRVRQSNATDALLHEGWHSNAGGTAYGASCWVYRKGTKSEVMAREIQAELAALTPWPDLGVIAYNHYETRETKAYAVIAEVAFHDKPEPAEWIRTHKRELAAALVRGTARALAKAYGGKFVDIAARPLLLDGGGGMGPVVVEPAPAPAPAPPPAPVVVQAWPDVPLLVDGIRGPVTVRAWQLLLASVGHYKGLVDGSWGPVSVKAEQTWLRALGWYQGAVDGWEGPMTVKALQRFLRSKGLYKGTIDGSRGPVTVKAEQGYLNDQRKYQ